MSNAFVANASQLPVSGVAEGAITRYYIVKLGTADQQVAVAGAGEACFGIAQDGVADTVEVAVVIAGTSFCIAGDVIARGAWVKADASGKAVTANAGDEVVGKALVAAAADGDRIAIQVNPHVLGG